MLKLSYTLISLVLAASAFAQDAQKDQAAEKDKEAQARLRAEGSAGGLGQPLTKEQRQAVNSGARQHRNHREALDTVKKDAPQGEVRDEHSSDRKKGRGAQ